MKDMERRTPTSNWRMVGIAVLLALVLPVSVFLFRHRTAAAPPQVGTESTRQVTTAAVPPAAVGRLPPLSSIAQQPGRAVVSLDTVGINGKTTVVAGLKSARSFQIRRGDTVVLTGWAYDPAAGEPAGGVTLRFGARDARATYGLARPDVATAFKVPALAPVGFNGQLSGRDLRPGANTVSLVVFSHNLGGYYVNPSDVVLDLR